jgi:hypothetical protein
MKLRPGTLVAAALALAMNLLLVFSCDVFFSTNLFKMAGLGQVKASDLANENSAELVGQAYTADGMPASSFFAALTSDPAAKAKVLATLQATYSNGAASAAQQQDAAALAAQVELITTGADQLVNNVIGPLTDNQLSSSSTPAQAVATVQALIPANLSSNKASFEAAVNALMAANAPYTALGGSIGASGVAGDINVGTAAQSAVVAAVVGGISATSGSPPETVSTADLLWALSQGASTSGYTITFTAPDTQSGTPLGSLVGAVGLNLNL